MAVKEYVEACKDIFQSGFVKEGLLKKHIEQQVFIDKYLPDLATFFFVVEPCNNKYHFIGKQQEIVSGYSNEEILGRGLDFLFECVHPSEVGILIDRIYPDIANYMALISQKTDVKRTFTQFNYRFKTKRGNYINLLEHLYVLETDQEGKPALFLGNIITLENTEVLPLRLTIKVMSGTDLMETIFSTTYDSKKTVFADVTPREMDIMYNLALGKTSKQIGKELFISSHTVDTHRRSLLKKLNCNSVVELTRLAFQNGLL